MKHIWISNDHPVRPESDTLCGAIKIPHPPPSSFESPDFQEDTCPDCLREQRALELFMEEHGE